jgi:nitrite reductase/ring-hydroxylating ferredoxin subunit
MSVTVTVEGTEGASPPPAWRPGFIERLLGGIVVLMLAAVFLGISLYLLPPPHLQLPEIQPAYRVGAAADIPIGGSRLVNWGERVILVVRSGEQSYAALQGTAPTDGCILRWDPVSMRVLSPCTSLVYDLHGNVVRGLTTVPLQRYVVFVRQGTVYVTGS